MIEITMENGKTIRIELDAEAAPITVENFTKLVKQGFYDGLTFHRIIPGFMIPVSYTHLNRRPLFRPRVSLRFWLLWTDWSAKIPSFSSPPIPRCFWRIRTPKFLF